LAADAPRCFVEITQLRGVKVESQDFRQRAGRGQPKKGAPPVEGRMVGRRKPDKTRTKTVRDCLGRVPICQKIKKTSVGSLTGGLSTKGAEAGRKGLAYSHRRGEGLEEGHPQKTRTLHSLQHPRGWEKIQEKEKDSA